MQVSEVRHKVAGGAFGFFHDFCITDNYYVMLENPMRLDFWKLLTKYTVGKACIAECLEFRPELPMKVRLPAGQMSLSETCTYMQLEVGPIRIDQ